MYMHAPVQPCLNLHFSSQSWGTKGSDKVSMDLGSAATGKGGKRDEVILAVPTEEKDINSLYADELRTLAEPAPKEIKTISPTQKQEDYYKTFRTNVSEAEHALLVEAMLIPNSPIGPARVGDFERGSGCDHFVSNI